MRASTVSCNATKRRPVEIGEFPTKVSRKNATDFLFLNRPYVWLTNEHGRTFEMARTTVPEVVKERIENRLSLQLMGAENGNELQKARVESNFMDSTGHWL
jgi:hypothetical protein